MTATYALLTLALLSLWTGGDRQAPLGRQQLWLGFFAASLVAGVVSGILHPLGLVWTAAFAGACFAFSRPGASRIQLAATAGAIVILAAGLMSHRLPGFDNPRVIFDLRFTPDALPYSLYLNYDKTLIGLFILGWCHARISRAPEWKSMLAATAPIAAGLIALIMILSLALGYVRFAPKLPPESALWLWVNLCFTCVAEEALFRGFVQAQLRRWWHGHRWGGGLAVAVAAVLFGLAHFAGGAMYVALATLAGAGYGWAYHRTGRVEAAILAHFVLNTVHFFGFTYPALEHAPG